MFRRPNAGLPLSVATCSPSGENTRAACIIDVVVDLGSDFNIIDDITAVEGLTLPTAALLASVSH